MRRAGTLALAFVLSTSLLTPAFAERGRDNGRGHGNDRGWHDNRGGDRDNGRHDGGGWDRHGGDWDRHDGDRHDGDRRGGDWNRGGSYAYRSPPRVVYAPPQRVYVQRYFHDNPWRYDRGFAWRPAIGLRVPYGIPCRPVPAGLAYGLPYYPGYGHYIVGRDIVLIALATGLIVDVLFDAF